MAEEGEGVVVPVEEEGIVVAVEGKGEGIVTPIEEEGRVIPVEEPTGKNTTLIESLKEQPSFLMQQYNEQVKKETKPGEPKGPKRPGGVYVPPHKLRELQQEMMDADPSSEAHQKLMWQLLRKSINGMINKVNITNIQNVVVELFNENIHRGRGLLARSIIKAQMASPNFTHVYAALISVINTKVPEMGLIIAKRIVIQFKRSFGRNNKIVCVATTRMVAHLVNQKVVGEYLALQILMILLSSPTEDSVEIACDFMIEVGQVLAEITPAGSIAIFERFKSLLHEAEIEQKAQYSIENLFAVRKTGFKEHPGVLADLDLVEPMDQITHQLDIEEEITGEEHLNLFKLDPKYLETEEEWEQIKMEILGEENIARLKEVEEYEEEFDSVPQEQGIVDMTEQDLINLRKTIYLAIQSTVNFEECAHKVLKMNIAKGYEHELIDMILECCMIERIYQSFFGLLAERFCIVDDKYKDLFIQAFLTRYRNIFKEEANKIRNLAHLFSHLFYRKAFDWKILEVIKLTPDHTTAAARMFLKIFLKDIAENMGINNLAAEFQKEEMQEYYQGLFPIDNPTDLRFAINYYTAIGLGKLTEQMREVLAMQEDIINERKRKEEEAMAKLLLEEEEEMMKMILDEQKVKEEENRVKEEEKKERELEREKDRKRSHSRERRRRSRSKEYDSHRDRRRERSNQKQTRRRDQDREHRGGSREKDRRREREREDRDRQHKQKRQQEKQKETQNKKQKQLEREQKQQQEKEERRKIKNREEKQKEEKKARKEDEEKARRKRERSRSRDKRNRRTDKKRDQSPRRKHYRSQSEETPKARASSKAALKKKKQKEVSSSSGISSSSSDSSDSSSSEVKVAVKKVQKAASHSSMSDSSDSSSSSSVQSPQKNKRRWSESS